MAGRDAMRTGQSLVLPYACAYADTPPVRLMSFVIFVVAAVIGPLAMVSASPAHAQSAAATEANPADPFAAYITEAARRFSVPASWIRAVMRAESAGNVSAVSSAGAMGLMQIMPQTWADLRVRHRLGTDPFDPRDNILAGAAYLREMHDRFGSPGFLAAYNAGPGRYEEHLATGWDLPAETQAFVAALAPLVGGERADGAIVAAADPQAWTRAPIFIARVVSTHGDQKPSLSMQTDRRPANHSFTGLSAITPQSDGLFMQSTYSERPQ
jgi:SLT domain-containing protein